MMNWHDYFLYDAETGVLTWKERHVGAFVDKRAWGIHKSRYGGRPVLHMNDSGYYCARVNGTMYRVHRIIWEMHYGQIPEGMDIDHIDGSRTNNTLLNLRIATRGQNLCNRGAQKNSKLRIKGVQFDPRRNRYVATLMIHGKVMENRWHRTKGLAAVAYAKASLRYHGRFSPYYPKESPSQCRP